MSALPTPIWLFNTLSQCTSYRFSFLDPLSLFLKEACVPFCIFSVEGGRRGQMFCILFFQLMILSLFLPRFYLKSSNFTCFSIAYYVKLDCHPLERRCTELRVPRINSHNLTFLLFSAQEECTSCTILWVALLNTPD